MGTEKAYVTVRRLDSSSASLRRFTISIDGEQVARIKQGQTVTFEVDPGTHIIRVRMDWDRSEKIEFMAVAGRTVYFVCEWRKRLFNPNMFLEQIDDVSRN